MRTLKAALIAAVVAVAGLALGATQASAKETEVEVIDEHTGANCSPCNIHIVGESHFTDIATGVVFLTCEDELEGFINHDGTGELDWVGAPHGAPGCNTVNCQTGDESHWPLFSLGELSGGEEHITRRLCFRSPVTGAELHCDGEIGIADTSGAHAYELDTGTGNLCFGGSRRFEGHWAIESSIHDAIEFHHHDDEPL